MSDLRGMVTILSVLVAGSALGYYTTRVIDEFGINLSAKDIASKVMADKDSKEQQL